MDPSEACEDPDLISDNVTEAVWNLKLYGPDIEVIGSRGVPSGWILVDRNNPLPYYMPLLPTALSFGLKFAMLILTDPDPPEKVVKKWDRYDFKDPNRAINVERARWKKPPTDYYNMGYIYTYDRTDPPA